MTPIRFAQWSLVVFMVIAMSCVVLFVGSAMVAGVASAISGG